VLVAAVPLASAFGFAQTPLFDHLVFAVLRVARTKPTGSRVTRSRSQIRRICVAAAAATKRRVFELYGRGA